MHAQESKIEMENREALPSLWTVDENMVVRPVSYSNMGSHHDYNATVSFITFPTFLFIVVDRLLSPTPSLWDQLLLPVWLLKRFHPGIHDGLM